ncbi:Transcriptional regulator, AbiEi antitoxin, Type IV TA system [Raineyella antarctica]|uniref:Transcriptional regulator, AbiEi antitoxin, Type IV TA system n=1 Tax=Raineyella antarctica TaxID=1577474 RepID=A0A1G6HVT9_9ACTN|nr:type IV toxin-antitoxin system AbiEi family antitoxin domain-containing protein [Raineyella antarctica]SDB98427.1 Transcriptional regulator, AbiEi antitoxin, Type IV TA system [Raineyella antarctica]
MAYAGPNGIITIDQLARCGMTTEEVSRAVRNGSLVRLRRGTYATGLPDDPTARHRQLVEATVPALGESAIISHQSAAVCHGLAVPWSMLDPRIHLTRALGGGNRRPRIVSHVGHIPSDHVTTLDGLRLTSVAWSVVDCARTLGFGGGLAVADSALRLAPQRGDMGQLSALLDSALQQQQGRHGIATARAVVAFASPLPESPGESVSRAVLRQVGLPDPVLQYEIRTPAGVFVARTDMAWPEDNTVGEFDGRLKYRRGRDDAADPGSVVYREKRREEAIRDLDWEVVRWGWDELGDPAAVAVRIRSAMARGRRRKGRT